MDCWDEDSELVIRVVGSVVDYSRNLGYDSTPTIGDDGGGGAA